jgi:hypothetical protein
MFKQKEDRESFRLISNFIYNICGNYKVCHYISIGSNYLQNEAGVAEFDDAVVKAVEVMKRLLHTQKVRTVTLHIIWFPICV